MTKASSSVVIIKAPGEPGTASGSIDPDISQVLVLVAGLIFSLFGIIGFAITGVSNFAGPHPADHLLGAQMNPLRNVVDIVVGFGALTTWRDGRTARRYAMVVAGVFTMMFVYGLFTSGKTGAINFLSLNAADNIAHGVTVVLAFVAIFAPKLTRR